MNLKVRRLLFLTILSVFVVSSAYLVLSVQGMVIDFQKFRIVKTGGLFLNPSPGDAEIMIDGEKPETISTGLFSNGVIVKNLPPGKYSVEITKAGFSSWKKILEVKSGFITSASQIILWPDKLETAVTAENADDFTVTGKGIVFENRKNGVYFGEVALKGKRVFYSEPSSNVVVTDDDGILFLTDLDAPDKAVNLGQIFNSLKQRQLELPGEVPVVGVAAHPFTDQKVLIFTKSSLYSLDFRKLALERLATLEKIASSAVASNEVFLWDGKTLHSVNLLLKTRSSYPLVMDADSRLIVSKSGRRVLILDNKGGLHLYNFAAATTTLVADNVHSVAFSQEEKRAALTGKDGSIAVLYLADYQSDILHKAGTKTFVLPPRNRSIAEGIRWFPKTNNHLVGIVDGNLWVGEVDNRDLINSAVLVREADKFAFVGNRIYFLKAGSIFETSLSF
ncbi:MAG TPA: hypothetical protein VNK70_00370 [Candidatus Paceibacterota bacterium]|nr:hypothetical protein [Candidatus Paceibacterota bacterium]